MDATMCKRCAFIWLQKTIYRAFAITAADTQIKSVQYDLQSIVLPEEVPSWTKGEIPKNLNECVGSEAESGTLEKAQHEQAITI